MILRYTLRVIKLLVKVHILLWLTNTAFRYLDFNVRFYYHKEHLSRLLMIMLVMEFHGQHYHFEAISALDCILCVAFYLMCLLWGMTPT